MLKDIIERAKAEARENYGCINKSCPIVHDFVIEELDNLITETAQIVAREVTASLTEAHNKQTGELLKEIMKFVTANQKDDGTIYPKITSHAVVCFLQKKAKEFNIEVK
jgi:hypothetical protein